MVHGGASPPRARVPREQASLTASLFVSYRDWESNRSEEIVLSVDHAVAGGGRVAIRPRWGDWIDAVVACHRSLLDPLARSPFDATLASWQRRHEQKLRQVTASLDGPVILGAQGGEAFALIGLGPRADAALVTRNLVTVLDPIGDARLQAAGQEGHVTIDALAGTEFSAVEWRTIVLGRKSWMLVTRAGEGESVAAALSAE